MVKGFFKVLLSTILIALVAISVVGCEDVTEEEAKAMVEDFLTKAYELNEIYYGAGLEYKDDGNPNNIYKPVRETEKYTLKSALVERTNEVFSQTYAYSLIDMAFNGVQSEINQNSVMARYMVMGDFGDDIYVNIEYEPAVDKISEYDFSTIEIGKISGTFIEATVKTVEGVTVDVTLINESDGWRLDSASY